MYFLYYMYNIILLMSPSCPYCVSFKKVYKKIKKKYNDKFKFYSFDIHLDKEKIIKKFKTIYEKYSNSGVPTIILKKKNKQTEITMPNIDIKTKDDIKNFVNLFYSNIKQAKKTLKSKIFDTHIQHGGENEEDLYFDKYQKYKKKYYLLKNN